MFKRKPDVVIGSEDNPYMERWHLIPRNGIFDIYLHKISRSDDDRALHDHRADNISFILSGQYTEILAPRIGEEWDVIFPNTYKRKRFSLIFRKAEQPHRLVLESDPSLTQFPQEEKPVWTLWIKFGDRRDWGFWPIAEDGRTFTWMDWKSYLTKFGDRDQVSTYKV